MVRHLIDDLLSKKYNFIKVILLIKRGKQVLMLDEKIREMPRIKLGCLPTPIERLFNFEKKLGSGKIYIKRDDLTGLGPGGNKIRSLEFILGEAVSEKCGTIIVAGPLQSNLCTLAACACAKAGLKCISVHNGVEPKRAEGNQLLNKLLNIESHYLGNISSNERNNYARELKDSLTKKGSPAYFIENGATTGMGAMGYVDAIIEMKKQAQELNIPLKSIYAPGGNGGVAAGLIYGNALYGFPFEINIISVEYNKKELTYEIEKVFNQLKEIINVPFDYKTEDICNIIDDYTGEGWGINTLESERIVHTFPQMEGIFVENVYTSKVLAGMEDLAKQGKLPDGACYLHTGGFGSLFSQY